MDLAQAGAVEAVVVVKLDRLFRSLKHLVVTLDQWQTQGVRLVSLQNPDLDQSTSQGRLITSILSALAEFERDLIRSRVVAGLANARAKGKRLGRRREHDPNAIRRLRAAGQTYRAIQAATGAPMGVIVRALKVAPKTPRNRTGEDEEFTEGDAPPSDEREDAP
jgi:DNA invertase Pin-like site-specific DNA recombinase